MKHEIMKKAGIIMIALLAVPGFLLAQEEKEEKEKKVKKEKQVQQIIITRTGDKEEKMVVEVDGDKVKINGKDAKDFKDAEVHVNIMKAPNVYFNRNRDQRFMTWNDDAHASIFSEDENRAMLGVNTEGHEKGAEIISVVEGSAAEKAGLKKGDILTKVGGRKIESTDDVSEEVRSHKPGEKVSINYLRDGKEKEATAELGKWKGIKMNAVSVPRLEAMGQLMDRMEPSVDMPLIHAPGGTYTYAYGGRPKLGLSIQDTDDGTGVKVLEVDEESNAAKAGIRENDVIISIDGQEVKGTDDVVKAMKPSKDKYTYNFKVKRNGKTENIEVKVPRKLKTAEL